MRFLKVDEKGNIILASRSAVASFDKNSRQINGRAPIGKITDVALVTKKGKRNVK